MKYIRYAFWAILAIVLICVALANRGPATLNLLPTEMAELLNFQYTVTVPVFIVIFGGIVAGLLIGFVWEWLREHKHRAVAAQRKTEVKRLERQLKKTQDERDKDKDEVLAILDQSA
ncbi:MULTISPECIES: lipopolysaccharide assembly protein LapA domain-containing protein [Roseobacteraceae]|uniref:lipopolysaccharide assembly protein LapA domain-containing protein n=1 Tax=Roseobacteraceae TaxID=2854170 RepID=UPI00080A9D07|nr:MULTISPECIES: LapA family protein [Roseobacteraceae]ANT62754.1 phosphoribosylanthranilate isomerase [Salipiger sp. CCB-MM3]MCA0996337.1 LapA family protein [Alloyangia pacifica]NDW00244.1 LapA family protein [Salipiger sp. PrR002]NDW58617.1 LapA family protein [Salipiger sp. PrR004]